MGLLTLSTFSILVFGLLSSLSIFITLILKRIASFSMSVRSTVFVCILGYIYFSGLCFLASRMLKGTWNPY